MATIAVDKKREEGRSIFLKTNPTVGLLALTGFVDDSNDPVGSRFFTKTFRYTTNGVTYSEWIPLTIPNITAITFDPKDVVVIEISYFKEEPIGETLLQVSKAEIEATTEALVAPHYFKNSLFAKYFDFNDVGVLSWYINVLEKLYEKGLIPSYIERSNEDYLEFWAGVCRMFSFYVNYARVFSTFYNREALIQEFVNQRGINTSPEDELIDYQYILETFYHQYARRGSIGIIDEKSKGATVDGELLRLIHKKTADEFMFCLFAPERFGWCLEKSSPLYRGLRANDNLNKVVWSRGESSMDNCLTYATGIKSLVEEDGKNVLSLDGGILYLAEESGEKVDNRLDYTISFQVKTSSMDAKLSLMIDGLDDERSAVDFVNRRTGALTSVFFTSASISRVGEWVTVKAYIYNKDRGLFVGDRTSIKAGSNLLFTSNIRYIRPYIYSNDKVLIKDVKLTPMMTPYSRGVIQSPNFISVWLTNRNNTFSKSQLESYIRRYLLPYNTNLSLIDIPSYVYNELEEEIDSTFWIGSGEYCRKTIWIGEDPACEIRNTIWVPDEDSAYCEQQS